MRANCVTLFADLLFSRWESVYAKTYQRQKITEANGFNLTLVLSFQKVFGNYQIFFSKITSLVLKSPTNYDVHELALKYLFINWIFLILGNVQYHIVAFLSDLIFTTSSILYIFNAFLIYSCFPCWGACFMYVMSVF